MTYPIAVDTTEAVATTMKPKSKSLKTPSPCGS